MDSPDLARLHSLLRARRRTSRLRRAVGALVGLAVCALAHRLTAPRTPQPFPLALRHTAITPSTPPHGTPRALSGKSGAVSWECPNTDALSLPYPAVCSFGRMLTFAYLGGATPPPDFWFHIGGAVALIMANYPTDLEVSSAIGRLTNLMWLVLGDQPTVGPIPSQIGLLTKLQYAFLGFSNFPNLPSEVGCLTALTDLQLQFNQISSALPSQLGLLTNLLKLSLQENFFWSTVPSQLGRLVLLSSLRANNNNLTGSLPTQLGLLTALVELFFGSCPMHGVLPSELGLLTRLETLLLDDCGLFGTIPAQFSALASLTKLDLNDNVLVHGSVPIALDVLRCTNTFVTNRECSTPVPSAPPDPAFASATALRVVFSMAVACLVVLAVVGALVVRYRRRRVIRATNPLFTMLILLGLATLTASIFPYGVCMADVARSRRRAACRVLPHTLVQGVCLVAACITARNYPIWRIFTHNPGLQLVTIKPADLLKPVVAISLAGLVVVLPLSFTIEAGDEFGCYVAEYSWLQFVALALAAGTMAAATYSSFQIRSVPSEFNDTQHIAKAMYNTATFGTAMLCVGYLAREPTYQFLIVSLCVILCVLSFVALVNGPKLWELRTRKSEHVPRQPRVRVFRPT